MNPVDRLALLFLTLLAIGLALIAYGTGIITGKGALGFTIFGGALSYAAIRLYESLQNGRR